MQVYIELSLAENFCMDFCLLYAAKAITKNRAGIFRLCISAALGACFAVAFPLIPLSGWLTVTVKLLAGVALCAAAGRYSRFTGFVKFTAVFFALSFALGGALTGLFSLADISYLEGGGFVISSVPVGIPLFCVLALALTVKAVARKIASSHVKTGVTCRIYAGQSCVCVAGFYDSGNSIYHFGSPVSVIPKPLAEKLVDVRRIKTFTVIHTVAGSKKMAVITADKIEIDDGKAVKTINNVKLGVSPNAIYRAVLHPDLAEDN